MVLFVMRRRQGLRTCGAHRVAGKGTDVAKALCRYGQTIPLQQHERVESAKQRDPLRAFFAFDPHRTGILLCAGNKAGNEKRFYDEMIPLADREFAHYLNRLNKKE